MSQLLRVLVGVRVCFCGRSHTILAVSLTQQYKEPRTFFTYRWAKDPLYNNRKQKRGRWRKSDWGCVPAWLGHVSHRRFSREPTDHLVRVCTFAQRVHVLARTHKSGKVRAIYDAWDLGRTGRGLYWRPKWPHYEGPQLQQNAGTAPPGSRGLDPAAE